MFVRVELADATVDYPVEDLAEARRVIRALTWFWPWRRWAVFDYASGKRRGCIRRRDIKRAGMLTQDEIGQGK